MILSSHHLAAVLFIALTATHCAKAIEVSEACDPEAEFHQARVLQTKAGHASESPDESPWLLGSFMLLRAAVALRSLHEASESLMWQGIAFACFTRCIVILPDPGDVASLLLSGIKEILHVYGLRMVLRQMSPSCS
ncbi:Uncharacterized protein SCF082_LOCUS29825 [Durusdinium trenchii]|uniref:Uncharacterized protein n=1 Tax=Durusdinium trenchii TaxID=1381693 RepID=A0ABP0MYJ0_9DINO